MSSCSFQAESEAAIRQKENDHQELTIMRRRSLVGGGGQIITQMYETILLRYAIIFNMLIANSVVKGLGWICFFRCEPN